MFYVNVCVLCKLCKGNKLFRIVKTTIYLKTKQFDRKYFSTYGILYQKDIAFVPIYNYGRRDNMVRAIHKVQRIGGRTHGRGRQKAWSKSYLN